MQLPIISFVLRTCVEVVLGDDILLGFEPSVSSLRERVRNLLSRASKPELARTWNVRVSLLLGIQGMHVQTYHRSIERGMKSVGEEVDGSNPTQQPLDDIW